MSLVVLVVLAAAALLLLRAAFRSRELFVLQVENGRTRVVRGRAPPALLEGFADVFERAKVRNARVKVVRDSGRARLVATGLDEFVLQRARNVLGVFPAHKLLGPNA